MCSRKKIHTHIHNIPFILAVCFILLSVFGSYCECFAAGVFCLDSCSCENCYNKPEFEDTVFDARQQIESRNPLAFAPRVVKHDFNSSPKIMVTPVKASMSPVLLNQKFGRILNMRPLCRKKLTGRPHHQPGTREVAIARSRSA